MTQSGRDWESVYQQDELPPWSIGEPQPEIAALIEQGKVRSDVLDAGCGHAALSLTLAERGYTVVGLDVSASAVDAATAVAAERGLSTATFRQADVSEFGSYDGRFSTILDSGLFHALPPERRAGYLKSIHRAGAPGAGLYILAFAAGARSDAAPGPAGFTESELRDLVSKHWQVDQVRPATLYGNPTQMAAAPAPLPDVERDEKGRLKFPGLLLSAHKPE